MPEHVADKTNRHRFDTPLPSNFPAEKKVANYGFVADTEQIGHGEPRTDENPAASDLYP